MFDKGPHILRLNISEVANLETFFFKSNEFNFCYLHPKRESKLGRIRFFYLLNNQNFVGFERLKEKEEKEEKLKMEKIE